MKNSEFQEKYDAVFNSDGSVKLCGREKCKDLIIACMTLSNMKSDGFFGNEMTGMMNIQNIQQFKKTL